MLSTALVTAAVCLAAPRVRTANNTVRFEWDGDGKADAAVLRNGGSVYNWYIRRSSDGVMAVYSWGSPTLDGYAVPGDYDGDGRSDFGVFRGTTGAWCIRRSIDGSMYALSWGVGTMTATAERT